MNRNELNVLKRIPPRLVLGIIALAIVVVTLVSAQRNVSEPPLLSIHVGDRYVTTACIATGPSALDGDGAGAIQTEINIQGRPSEGLSPEFLESLVEHVEYDQGFRVSDDFLADVKDNTRYYCDRLRENRDTELTLILGSGLLLLMLTGIATVMAPSRREHREVQEG